MSELVHCSVRLGNGRIVSYLIDFINNIKPTEYIRPLIFGGFICYHYIQAAQYQAKTIRLRDETVLHTVEIVA